PAFLNRRTLLYLASDSDGSGPWLYGMDTERRIPHRLGSGVERYTSLTSSADGHRLLFTTASPQSSLWRLRIDDPPGQQSSRTRASPVRIPLTTSTGFSPRLGSDYLLYVTAAGPTESIWKLANGAGTELWKGQGVHVLGGPAIS